MSDHPSERSQDEQKIQPPRPQRQPDKDSQGDVLDPIIPRGADQKGDEDADAVRQDDQARERSRG